MLDRVAPRLVVAGEVDELNLPVVHFVDGLRAPLRCDVTTVDQNVFIQLAMCADDYLMGGPLLL